MSNNIKFPKKFNIGKINDPAIDSIKKTAKRISNWLHEDLKKIIEPIQVLPELTEDIGDFKKRVIEQFGELFAGQVAVEMKAREANIRVAESKAQLVEQHVERKKRQLQEAQERVTERYTRLAEAVAEDHEADLRRLDSHAYRIVENVYPEEIQAKFSHLQPAFWRALAARSVMAVNARSSCLQDGFEASADALARFQHERRRFYQELERHAAGVPSEGRYGLDYWFVQVEDTETGDVRIEVAFEWDLNGTPSPLDPSQEAELKRTLREQVSAQQAKSGGDPSSRSVKELGQRLADTYDVSSDEVERFERDAPRFLHLSPLTPQNDE
jgi:hypothetical protein